MKKFSLALGLFVALLFSCKSTSKQESTTDSTSIGQNTDSLAVLSETQIPDACLEFDALNQKSKLYDFVIELKQLKCKNYQSISEAISILKSNLANASEDQKDSLFYVFDQFHNKVLDNLNSNTQQLNPEDFVGLYSQGSKLTSEQEKIHQDLKNNGFDFGYSEGTMFFIINRDVVFKNLSDNMSPAMKAYFTQLEIETKEPMSEDAGISISGEEFLKRLLFWEKFNKDNPQFIYKEETNSKQKYILGFIMTGMDNTPLFEYNQTTAAPYFIEMYTLAETMESTPSIEIIKNYNKILSKFNNKDSKERNAFLDDLKAKNVL